ncbi:9283_t:CDS:1, partial [Cetraspora pellucida]
SLYSVKFLFFDCGSSVATFHLYFLAAFNTMILSFAFVHATSTCFNASSPDVKLSTMSKF